MKCDCYHIESKMRYISPDPYDVRKRETDVGICLGTRERDECDCGGDSSKCTFYPEVREKFNSAPRIFACPFCGGQKLKIESKRRKVRAGGYYQTRYMVCKKCHARGPVISSATTNSLDSIAWDREVLYAWNKRHETIHEEGLY